MDELNFKIIFVPQDIRFVDRNQLIEQIKNTVVNCGLQNISVSYSQIKKSEDEDYPEIEELSFFVQSKMGKLSSYGRSAIYKHFFSRWKIEATGLPCSYIALYKNEDFLYPDKPYVWSSYSRLSFGVLPHTGFYHEYKQLPQYSENSINFYHDTRNIVIEYRIQAIEFEIRFSYENLISIIVNTENFYEVFFYLLNPPLIFRKETICPKDGRPSYTLTHRNLDFRPQERMYQQKKINRFECDFDISSSYKAPVTPYIDKDILGRANVLSILFSNADVVQKILNGIHFSCSEKPALYSCIKNIQRAKPFDPDSVPLNYMHFGCSYLITAILRRSFLAAAQASPDLSYILRKLNTYSQQNPESLEKALIAVLAALDSGKILNFWQAIDIQYQFYLTYTDNINVQKYIVPSKCSMIRRITLTPTRQLLWPPEIMFGNRVLRHYDADYSIRLSFRDDNMSSISFNAPFADDGVLDSCIKNPMTTGICIGSRKYEFLAWSNSQIRDHGVWMYAKDLKGQTVAEIREWMGDFSHIHTVPKYMARMGQSFSQTEAALAVPLDFSVKTEGDIEGGFDPLNGKPYCFSDGVGKISTELSHEVHQALGHDKLCSAFQIRYSGYKGMLVTDPTLNSAQIVFRKSMKKFDSPKNITLEIAKTSAPVSLQLNRPFITLLNHLGVRHRTFLRLQEEVLQTLTDMLFTEEKAAAFLISKTPNDLYKYEDLSNAGIHLTTEPFFKSLLLALHRRHIENIKSRANIPIDPKYGRNMLGVIDETGQLSYGEVFIQYSTDISYGETTRETTVKRGEVLVTKNPCMFPGDVRKFKAVDIPQLHHIVDCIVFPQRGPRPHPNEMAGSDLDGDEYSVLWFDDLIFRGPNKAPAHFPAVPCKSVPSITVKHMIDFLQFYIENDQVGAIANAHLAHADYSGASSDICLDIAKKFSVAVDFAKNGQSRQLEKFERPERFPDFMEKNHREIYKSKNALGKMYRVCKDFETENEKTSITYDDIKVDPDLIVPGWKTYESDALKAKKKYNLLFQSVLVNYGIQHEAEALSSAFTNLHCRFQERKDRNEIEKIVIGCIKHLQKTMREELLKEFENSGDINSTVDRILQKASACYVVTYSDPNAKFLSFPWILSEHLLQIKVRKTFARPIPFSPAILQLDEKILECASKRLLPHYIETRIWNDYDYLCDPQTLKYALQTLMLWAQDENIVEGPGSSEGLLYASVFIQLFLHFAEKIRYIKKRTVFNVERKEAYSSGNLCIEFLKFCSSFRFYNPAEMDGILPFKVFKYNKLAKRAIVSYHTFALTGKLKNLYFDKNIEGELIQMKPFQIESKIFGSTPIPNSTLTSAEGILKLHSKVDKIDLREIKQTKKIVVSARGSESAIKELKSILRKKHVFLKDLFRTGVIPEVIKL